MQQPQRQTHTQPQAQAQTQQEQQRLAQKQAWRAEMLMECQPWEGAVSPIAACRNWAFSGCGGSQPDTQQLERGFMQHSSGGRPKDVQILRISSGSFTNIGS